MEKVESEGGFLGSPGNSDYCSDKGEVPLRIKVIVEMCQGQGPKTYQPRVDKLLSKNRF